MKLLVDHIGPTPSEHCFEPKPSWWEEHFAQTAEDGWTLVEPPRFALIAYAAQSDLCLEGTFEATLELPCSRCLSRYRHALRDAYRLVLAPAGEAGPAEPEAADALARDGVCLGDELESGLYRGKEIHLDSFFKEVASLALPVQPLCREDCAGLCPHCGIDRNVASCECSDLKPTSPFAVLEVLRGGKPEGND